jgi:hypothetical protein
MFLALTVDTKNLIEITIGLIGIVAAISSFSIYLATLSQKQLAATELALLVAKIQRLIDRNQGEISDVKIEVRNIQLFLKAKHDFDIRERRPAKDLPGENSDFIREQ